jgi:hypothetical protein
VIFEIKESRNKKMLKKCLLIFATAFFLPVLTVFAQTPNAPHNPNNPLPQWVYDRARKSAESERLRSRVPSSGQGRVDPRNKNSPRRPVDPEAEEAREAILKVLMPPASYFEKYADFLRRDKTGIFRIFADKGCDKGLTISVEELGKCSEFIPIKGGGSLFFIQVSITFWFWQRLQGSTSDRR